MRRERPQLPHTVTNGMTWAQQYERQLLAAADAVMLVHGVRVADPPARRRRLPAVGPCAHGRQARHPPRVSGCGQEEMSSSVGVAAAYAHRLAGLCAVSCLFVLRSSTPARNMSCPRNCTCRLSLNVRLELNQNKDEAISI